MKLRHKLVLILFSFIVVPLIIFGYYFTKQFYHVVLENTIKTTSASLEQLGVNLKEHLLTYIQMSNLILSHKELIQFIGNPPDSWQEQLMWHRQIVNHEIGRYSIVNPFVKATVYVDHDALLLDHTHLAFIDESIKAASWYQEVMYNDQSFVWQGLVSKSRAAGLQQRQVFSFARPMISNYKKVGILLMEIDEAHLYSLISAESQDKDIMIVNPHNEIISSNRRDLLGSSITDYLQQQHIDNQQGLDFYHAVIEEQDSLVFVEEITLNSATLDWRIYAFVPDSHLLSEAKKERNLGVLVTALLSLWSMLAVLLVSWHFTKRIRLLARKMNSIHRGHFGEIVATKGKDEVSELIHTFNLMSVRLKELIVEVYESQLKRKDLEIKRRRTELKALQSQMNPHFLFNTLDGIRTSALRSRDQATVEKIELLAGLFRQTLRWQGDFILLETELQFVSDYIRLQQLRFKDKIDFEKVIEPETASLWIPKFIVQPVVENALIHGIEKSEKLCQLRIETFTKLNGLYIVIEDSGIGFTAERLQAIQNSLDKPVRNDENQRIGLQNVHDRIRLIYGDAFGLQLEDRQGGGAKVTLRLPAKQTMGGYHVQSDNRG